MTNDPRVQQLIDQLLDSHATPEEVCASCPKLLPEVCKRLRGMRRVLADLDVLFPPPTEPNSPPHDATPPLQGAALPAVRFLL
jgi:eukaryotic-like serine/threonine-protein kinase